jgi:intein-encoded DNA endonuclease-like protein
VPVLVDIPEKDLKRLYLNKRLSSRKIAKIFKCAYSTVDRKIHQANLPIRTLAEAHIIYPRKSFSGNLAEKAYLIGFRIGDLRVRKFHKNSETIKLDCASTKKDQIDLISSLFSRYGRVWISKPNKQGATQIECFLDLSFSFLLTKEPSKWIYKTKKHFLAFLSGFTDAEGSIFISKNMAHFAIGNYNLPLLKIIKINLEHYGIESPKIACSLRQGLIASHGYRYNHDYYTFSISKKVDMIKLLNLISIYLKHKNRIRQMNAAYQNIAERGQLNE